MVKFGKFLLIVSIALLCCNSFAQKNTWTLGLRLGYKGEGFERTQPTEVIKIGRKYGHSDYAPASTNLGISVFDLNAGLYLTYNITDRISITSGIAHLFFYTPTWKVYLKDDNKKTVLLEDGHLMYRPAQIPLYVKYAFPLGKSRFNMYGKLGLQLDILAMTWNNERMCTVAWHLPTDTNYGLYYESTATLYDRKVNILLNVGLGFEYRFKKGLGLSIEGEYYAGMRTLGQVLIQSGIAETANGKGITVGHYETEIPDILLLIKGSYWNISLGISYTFQRKQKDIFYD